MLSNNPMFLTKTTLTATAKALSCSKCSCSKVLNLDLSGGHRHHKNATSTFFFKKHEVKIKLMCSEEHVSMYVTPLLCLRAPQTRS